MTSQDHLHDENTVNDRELAERMKSRSVDRIKRQEDTASICGSLLNRPFQQDEVHYT